MIFAHIGSTTIRNVIGFECGTRALFDKLHGGDPLWLFIDQPNARNRSDLPGFLQHPTNYRVDKNNNLRLI
jgi:hypothetical protein